MNRAAKDFCASSRSQPLIFIPFLLTAFLCLASVAFSLGKHKDQNIYHAPVAYEPESNVHASNATIVYLLTHDVYLEQFKVSFPLLEQNWLHRFPVGQVTIFFTDNVCFEMLKRAANTESVPVELVPVARRHPEYLSRFPSSQCKCCCNNGTARTLPGGSIFPGKEYDLDYCWMNRFRTLDMYQHDALRDFNYFVQLDTDLYVEKPLPYDPIKIMAMKGAVFGFKYSNIRGAVNDCNEGLHKAVDEYFTRSNVKRVYIPPLGAQYQGNFNIGDLNFLRSENYLKFARFINDELTGVYTSRWGDQLYLPLVIGAFFREEKLNIFSDLHDEGYLVHKSKSLGQNLRKQNVECPSRSPTSKSARRSLDIVLTA